MKGNNTKVCCPSYLVGTLSDTGCTGSHYNIILIPLAPFYHTSLYLSPMSILAHNSNRFPRILSLASPTPTFLFLHLIYLDYIHLHLPIVNWHCLSHLTIPHLSYLIILIFLSRCYTVSLCHITLDHHHITITFHIHSSSIAGQWQSLIVA